MITAALLRPGAIAAAAGAVASRTRNRHPMTEPELLLFFGVIVVCIATLGWLFWKAKQR